MSRGMFYIQNCICTYVVYTGDGLYTYRREVCVARFDKMGDARASMRETSNSTGSHAFFVPFQLSLIADFGEPIGKNFFMEIGNVNWEVLLMVGTLLCSLREYHKSQKRARVDVLSRYNERYHNDSHIKQVVCFLEKLEDSTVVPENEYPSIHDFEMYMRFYEELHFLIQAKSMKIGMAYYMFGHYLMILDKNKDKIPIELNYNEHYWQVFNNLVNQMHEYNKLNQHRYKI